MSTEAALDRIANWKLWEKAQQTGDEANRQAMQCPQCGYVGRIPPNSDSDEDTVGDAPDFDDDDVFIPVVQMKQPKPSTQGLDMQ